VRTVRWHSFSLRTPGDMRLTGESSFRYHFSSDGQGGEVAGRDRKKPRQGGAGRQVGHQGEGGYAVLIG
jgi:hypothetical protein